MKWLLTGASGNVGRALARNWRNLGADISTIGVSRQVPTPCQVFWTPLDLCKKADLDHLLHTIRPTHIFHCAALAQPMLAQGNAELAWRVNRDITAQLSEYASRHEAWLLFCSSDFVFSGESNGLLSESSEALPNTVYGQSKLAGENEVIEREAGLVARLSLLFDPPSGAGPAGWGLVHHKLSRHQPLWGVTDEWRSPLSFRAAATVLTQLALQERRGLVHVGGAEVLSPYDLIVGLRNKMGSRSQVTPIRREHIHPGRPANLALDTSLLRQWLGEETLPTECVSPLMRRDAR